MFTQTYTFACDLFWVLEKKQLFFVIKLNFYKAMSLTIKRE